MILILYCFCVRKDAKLNNLIHKLYRGGKLKIANMYGNGQLGRVEVDWTSSGGIGQPPVASYDRYYYFKDHLGSIRMTIDENANCVNAQDYYAFGENLWSYTTGGIEEKYKFTGKERDTETGYDYFGERYYDSYLGRWLSADPLSNKYPGWSPYNYTLNNPLRFIDPNGKAIKDKKTGKWIPNGGEAVKLLIPALISALKGVPSEIPFVQGDNTWLHIYDTFLGGNTYQQGTMYGYGVFFMGDKIINSFNKKGRQLSSLSKYVVNSNDADSPLDYSKTEVIGKTSDGELIFGVFFRTENGFSVLARLTLDELTDLFNRAGINVTPKENGIILDRGNDKDVNTKSKTRTINHYYKQGTYRDPWYIPGNN